MTECQCGGQPDGPHTDICYLQGEIERLRAELAEARRDAERYQWLRKQFYSDSNNRTPHISQYPDPSGEYVQLTAGVDAAIDAAMAGGE